MTIKTPGSVSGKNAPRKPETWRLRLYVAGQTPKSIAAFANLKKLCEEYLKGKYTIEVVDLSGDISSFAIGQRVIVSPQICCGTCAFCRRGLTGRCASVPFAASYGMGREGDYGGAASDLMRVPYAKAMLVPLPKGTTQSE